LSLIELRRFRSRVEGEIARTSLGSHGLHAVLFDADSLGYADGFPIEVRLMVLDEDAAEAQAALASI